MRRIVFKKDSIDFPTIKKSLESGDIIIYPTDTVYGVGASINSLDGIKKIYTAKKRDFKSPLIALLSKRENIEKVAIIDENKKEIVERLTDEYWPGALTIILKKRENVPAMMVSNGDTVGVRVPNLELARQIIESIGGVLPTTSANISGERTPRSFRELSESFKERADILIDGGETPVGVESTIIDLTKEAPVILREGAIKKEAIEKIIGKI
ncbi:L-threonylcarbamoyladenylate synthase [uncultured Cetobacterium sp.]|uniref:L-threonylcarbamoyladenylate synthase n=1 Tax=uncultured Cetobacterium sp. TaxID=527638 RepID=UPI00263839A0|nr:L-threonylcarbamoyladenylate synthase [uncultured Cetobacterium sp.]